MAKTESRLDSLETHMVNMGASMKSLETQIGQLANALKDQNRELRSGKEVGVSKIKSEVEKEKKVEEAEVGESNLMQSKDESKQKPIFKPKLPYPQRFKKKALDEQFVKFLEIFKKLHINIPFADTLLQMPNYGKFLKEVMSRKRKVEEFETVNLIEEYFVVLDMEKDKNMSLKLRRPFLATAEAKIDVKKGKLSMGVEGEKVTFTVFKEARNSSKEKLFMIKQAKRMERCLKVESKVKSASFSATHEEAMDDQDDVEY
ncbi:uncharacterized protein [Henckelia pumila]|uniref:uncharacterized protein n=1 Tax=Henckelia pumila TaxID=405737 RepID=UPI003C6E6056